MGRTKIKPIKQPDETSCGPAALKHAATIFGIRTSIPKLKKLCRTSRNGTTNRAMVRAIRSLGLNVRISFNATLRELKTALSARGNGKILPLVNYLFHRDKSGRLDSESGHWVIVSGYSPAKKRITVLDSYTGRRRSYDWSDFRERWLDFENARHYNRRRTKYTVREKIIRRPLFLLSSN